MLYSEIKSIIDNVKANYSVFSFLKHNLGISINYPGQVIVAPHFIRNNDHNPSFQVNETFAYDYGTNKSFDIIDIVKAAFGLSFNSALEYLYGKSIWSGNDKFDDCSQHEAKQFQDKVSHWHSQLLANQELLDYLHSRKISDEFIDKFMLGYSKNLKRIIIPYWENGRYVYFAGRDTTGASKLPARLPDGTINPEHRSKYQKGKLSDSIIHENIPCGFQTLRPGRKSVHTYTGTDGNTYDTNEDDPKDITLCVLEGAFDWASFAQEGWQSLSPIGGNFNKQKQMKRFLEICRMYKQVFICFDNDNAGGKFQRSMCRTLFDAKINFICGHVPEEINGQKIKDVSDYYCAGGDLAELVRTAVPGVVELANSMQGYDQLADIFLKAGTWLPKTKLFQLKNWLIASGFSKSTVNFLYSQACSPMTEEDVANIVMKMRQIVYDTSGTFYEYSGGIWKSISDVIVQKYVGTALGMHASAARMKAVTSYIKAMYSDTYNFNGKHIISFLNGTLHMDVHDPEKRFTPHSPDDMCTWQLPYCYNDQAKAPLWEKYIREVSQGDPGMMKLLQQIAGYILVPDNRFQKFFYLVGDGRNGKSVFLNLLEAVYGSENVSSVQMSRLSSQFDPIALKDSIMNLCYETNATVQGNEDILKAVVSGDPIMAAHKGVDAVKFKTRSKLIVAANKFFASNDISYGLLRRIVFVKFDRTFTDSDDNKNLYSELMAELPGIFNWCYEGYLSLMKDGEFASTKKSLQTFVEFTEQLSPTLSFVREEMIHIHDQWLTEKAVYARYKTWCEEGGFKRVDRIAFMNDIRQTLRQTHSRIKIVEGDTRAEKIFVFPPDPEDEALVKKEQEDKLAREVIALGCSTAQAENGSSQGTVEAAQGSEEIASAEANDEKDASEPKEVSQDSLSAYAIAEKDVLNGSRTHAVEARDEQVSELAANEAPAVERKNRYIPIGQYSKKFREGEISPSEITLQGWYDLKAYYDHRPNRKPQTFNFDEMYERYTRLICKEMGLADDQITESQVNSKLTPRKCSLDVFVNLFLAGRWDIYTMTEDDTLALKEYLNAHPEKKPRYFDEISANHLRTIRSQASKAAEAKKGV